MLADNNGGAAARRRQRRMTGEGGDYSGANPPGAQETKLVHVAPVPSLSAVMVQGPPEKLLLAEKLIQTLDNAEMGGKNVIQAVHLKKTHAEDLALAVSRRSPTAGRKRGRSAFRSPRSRARTASW